jgi:hypothetical protein
MVQGALLSTARQLRALLRYSGCELWQQQSHDPALVPARAMPKTERFAAKTADHNAAQSHTVVPQVLSL